MRAVSGGESPYFNITFNATLVVTWLCVYSSPKDPASPFFQDFDVSLDTHIELEIYKYIPRNSPPKAGEPYS